jgi:hypothetical protein
MLIKRASALTISHPKASCLSRSPVPAAQRSSRGWPSHSLSSLGSATTECCNHLAHRRTARLCACSACWASGGALGDPREAPYSRAQLFGGHVVFHLNVVRPDVLYERCCSGTIVVSFLCVEYLTLEALFVAHARRGWISTSLAQHQLGPLVHVVELST